MTSAYALRGDCGPLPSAMCPCAPDSGGRVARGRPRTAGWEYADRPAGPVASDLPSQDALAIAVSLIADSGCWQRTSEEVAPGRGEPLREAGIGRCLASPVHDVRQVEDLAGDLRVGLHQPENPRAVRASSQLCQ